MSEKASQFRIGLFVVLGVAIVLGGLFVFGIRSSFQPTSMFETYTTGAGGTEDRARTAAGRLFR